MSSDNIHEIEDGSCLWGCQCKSDVYQLLMCISLLTCISLLMCMYQPADVYVSAC